MQTNMGGEWKETKKKKNKRKSSQSPETITKKHISSQPTPVIAESFNQFSDLMENDLSTQFGPAAELENIQSITKDSQKKPPPLFFKEEYSQEENSKLMKAVLYHDPEATFRVTGKRFQAFPSTFNRYLQLREKMKTRGIHFYTFTPSEDKPVVFVMRGIDHNIETSEIAKAIKDQHNTDVIRVVPMTRYTPEGRKPFNGFQVHFNKGTKLFNVQNQIKVICHYRIIWELPKKVKDVLQCKRCQRYGHGASNCNLPYRCVKCNNTHEPGQCKKSSNQSPICINCKEEHTANYRGCISKKQYVAGLQKRNPKITMFKPKPAPTPTTSLSSNKTPAPTINASNKTPASTTTINQAPVKPKKLISQEDSSSRQNSSSSPQQSAEAGKPLDFKSFLTNTIPETFNGMSFGTLCQTISTFLPSLDMVDTMNRRMQIIEFVLTHFL